MSTPDNGTAGTPAVPPHRDRILLDLGQDLHAMREELRQATGRWDGLVRDVAEVIGPDVATLRAQVAELQGRLDAVVGDGQEDDVEVVLSWTELTAQEANTAWKDLTRWVNDTLGYWFGITRGQLPDCWPLHRPAVVQLWALRLVYLAAHEGDRAGPLNMIEWNTRWLDAALGKVKEAIPDTMCRPVAGRPGDHLVPKHEAEQATARRDIPIDVRIAETRAKLDQARGRRAASTQQPSPYPLPPGLAKQQPAAEPDAAVEGAGESGPGWSGAAATEEVTGAAFWGEYAVRGRERDLRWRREREEGRAAAVAKRAEQEAGDQAQNE